ncbi:MAG: hypothetical protein A2046_02535 [Bacteroidetes bacterium GWA2_30_7]|nr:MAG: hypothetical protein A2046_02535 [Bacteroidetes bacterium GWA2_30_7]
MELKKLKQIETLTGKIIYHPAVNKKPDSFIDIVRIELSDELTRIDFGVFPDTKKYCSDWWVHIHKESFIRPFGTTDKLQLIHAVNIPYAPSKYFFRSKTECLPYTLYFPALPKSIEMIDIIEKEGEPNCFNFYNIKLETIKRKVIFVNN